MKLKMCSEDLLVEPAAKVPAKRFEILAVKTRLKMSSTCGKVVASQEEVLALGGVCVHE